MMITDVYHAGVILNSYLLDDLNMHRKTIVKWEILDAMRKLSMDIGDQIVDKFQAFKSVNMHFPIYL